MNFDFRLWNIHIGDPHPFNAHVYIDNGTGRSTPERYYRLCPERRHFAGILR